MRATGAATIREGCGGASAVGRRSHDRDTDNAQEWRDRRSDGALAVGPRTDVAVVRPETVSGDTGANEEPHTACTVSYY